VKVGVHVNVALLKMAPHYLFVLLACTGRPQPHITSSSGQLLLCHICKHLLHCILSLNKSNQKLFKSNIKVKVKVEFKSMSSSRPSLRPSSRLGSNPTFEIEHRIKTPKSRSKQATNRHDHQPPESCLRR
jgi:hypothetical protein